MKILRTNRKKERSRGFLVVGPLALVMVFGSGLSIGYLWLEIRCEALGRQLKQLEVKKHQVHTKYAMAESRWARMTGPEQLEGALRRHGLAMEWPREDQILRVDRTARSSGSHETGGRMVVAHRTTVHSSAAEKQDG